jgi:CHASE3 domain sensor protein
MDRYANEMESLREEMSQRMEKYANHMEDLREEMEM